MDQGSCLQYDPKTFFPERGATSKKKAEAKAICEKQCPVRLKCLAFILAHEKDNDSRRYGIAGGLTPTERSELQKKIDKMKEEEEDNG